MLEPAGGLNMEGQKEGLHPKMRRELGRSGTGIELEGDEEESSSAMVRRWLLLFC